MAQVLEKKDSMTTERAVSNLMQALTDLFYDKSEVAERATEKEESHRSQADAVKSLEESIMHINASPERGAASAMMLIGMAILISEVGYPDKMAAKDENALRTINRIRTNLHDGL